MRQRPGHVERLTHAAAVLLVPAPALAHSPGAALLSMLIIGCAASLLAYVARRVLLRRWNPPGSARSWWGLPALAGGEFLLTILLIALVWNVGWIAVSPGLVGAGAILALVSSAALVGPSRRSWRVAILGFAWPVAVVALYPAQWLLYVLLGG